MASTVSKGKKKHRKEKIAQLIPNDFFTTTSKMITFGDEWFNKTEKKLYPTEKNQHLVYYCSGAWFFSIVRFT